MQLLKINLAEKKVDYQKIDPEIIARWLGGRGLGAYLYSQDVRQPADHENSVFITTGSITGTRLPCASRTEVVTSSPLTDRYTASNFGGNFGAFLRSQKLMGLQITGRSEEPLHLHVENGQVDFLNASDLWGKNTKEVQENLGKNSDISVGCIGQAGENLVRFACVKFDTRAAGRTGTGWHWGYKKLKAITVKKSPSPTPVADVDELKQLLIKMTRERAQQENGSSPNDSCTPRYTDISCEMETYPASNYRRNSLQSTELAKIGHENFSQLVSGKGACWSCPLACERFVYSNYRTKEVRGPEYESIWALGGSCDNFNLDAIIEAAYLCDNYGLDTISTGATIAWFKESVEKELIDHPPVDPAEELNLIGQIGRREGIGDILAEGALRASKNYPGTKELIAHAKGLQLPAWDPRGAWGMALCYATSPTGGDHRKGNTIWHDVYDEKGRLANLEGKVNAAIQSQNEKALLDSSGFCGFLNQFNTETLAAAVKAVWDLELTVEELENIADRIIQKEREINEQLGLTPADDTLPPRILNFPIEINGQPARLSTADFKTMIEKYYQRRGWDHKGAN